MATLKLAQSSAQKVQILKNLVRLILRKYSDGIDEQQLTTLIISKNPSLDPTLLTQAITALQAEGKILAQQGAEPK